MNSTKIIGPPGTGKTTFLTNYLLDLLNKKKYEINEIAFCSFTKAAVESLKSKIKDKIEHENPKCIKNKDLQWFRTIHSLCYHLLQLDGDHVTNRKDQENFITNFITSDGFRPFYNKDFNLKNNSEILTEIVEEENEINYNWLFRLYSYLKQVYPKDWFLFEEGFPSNLKIHIKTKIDKSHLPVESAFNNSEEILKFFRDWDVFKLKNIKTNKGKKNRKYDFEDMLYEVWKNQLFPNVKLLIVDEFQDLTNLQYLIILNWQKYVKETIIAGDPDQSIYGFGGGKPNFLENFKGRSIILDKTYRLPISLLDYSKNVLENSPRFSVLKSAKNYSGKISRTTLEELVIPESGSVFILTRSRKDLNAAVELCISQDYIFGLIQNENTLHEEFLPNYISDMISSSQIINTNFIILFSAFSKYKKNQPLIPKEIEKLLSSIKFKPDTEYEIQMKKRGIIAQKRSILIPGSLSIIINWRKKLFDKLPRKFKFLEQKETLSRTEINEYFLKKEYHLIHLCHDNDSDSILQRILYSKKDTKYQKEFFRKAIKDNLTIEDLLNPRIKIGTIHASKGKDADTVIIISNATKYEMDNNYDLDEERRVWYVAVTRAKEQLIIVDFNPKRTTKFLPPIN